MLLVGSSCKEKMSRWVFVHPDFSHLFLLSCLFKVLHALGKEDDL